MAWGMRGTYFAVAIRVMPGLIWDGIEVRHTMDRE